MDSANSDKEKDVTGTATKTDDCFACKIIGGTSLFIASLYVLRVGMRAKTMPNRVTSAIFSTSLGYTGLARFLDLYPFNQQPVVEPSTNVS